MKGTLNGSITHLQANDHTQANETDKKELEDTDEYGATKALRKAINEKYQIVEILGKGSYGCVSKATCRSTGRVVALKIMVD